MLKDEKLDTLKRTLKENGANSKTLQAITKMQSKKRLTRKEFLQTYDALRKEGPQTKYQHPENWLKSDP